MAEFGTTGALSCASPLPPPPPLAVGLGPHDCAPDKCIKRPICGSGLAEVKLVSRAIMGGGICIDALAQHRLEVKHTEAVRLIGRARDVIDPVNVLWMREGGATR